MSEDGAPGIIEVESIGRFVEDGQSGAERRA